MKKFTVATTVVEYRVVYAKSAEEAFEKNNNCEDKPDWVEVESRSAEDAASLELTWE